MGKFNFNSTIDKVKASMKKDKRRSGAIGVGSDLSEISKNPEDYVVMPEWWEEAYGVPGLPFGKIVQIAGNSDTGKTSLAIEAMKQAQAQGYGILYVETEGKTTPQDLENKGIDPSGVLLVKSSICEEAFDSSFKVWDQFFEDYPSDKLLYIYDSYGNTVSMRDAELDLTKDSQKPGGSAKTNRMGINTMISRMQTDPVAVLIVNYTYDNIGSHGKTNAGGNALNFFSMITIQASRVKFLDKQIQGEKVVYGAQTKWNTFKNHFAKALTKEDGTPVYLPKSIQLQITAEGFKRVV